ncbi:hypothetical protein RN001_004432 [Aquatica leii]|uniref:Uncharacterized protein n=1 Tax=Aquatica leii TaxID=1421715 RepID=A0AAN7SPJ1_9COLE|nr:hypothetical protein RN001_004432 [Aquatica leii]
MILRSGFVKEIKYQEEMKNKIEQSVEIDSSLGGTMSRESLGIETVAQSTPISLSVENLEGDIMEFLMQMSRENKLMSEETRANMKKMTEEIKHEFNQIDDRMNTFQLRNNKQLNEVKQELEEKIENITVENESMEKHLDYVHQENEKNCKVHEVRLGTMEQKTNNLNSRIQQMTQQFKELTNETVTMENMCTVVMQSNDVKINLIRNSEMYTHRISCTQWKGSEDVYESKWFAYKYLHFLSDKDSSRETATTETAESETHSETEVSREPSSLSVTSAATTSTEQQEPQRTTFRAPGTSSTQRISTKQKATELDIDSMMMNEALKLKLLNSRDKPYRIHRVVSPTTYEISTLGDTVNPIGKYHVSALTPYIADPDEDPPSPTQPIRRRRRPRNSVPLADCTDFLIESDESALRKVESTAEGRRQRTVKPPCSCCTNTSVAPHPGLGTFALANFKSKTKQKAAKINQSQNKTGGGPVLEITLTLCEERLLSLMGTKSIKENSSLEFGVNLQQHQLNTSTTLREMPSISINEEVLIQLRSQPGEKSTAKESEIVNAQTRKHGELSPCPRGSKYRNTQKSLSEQITDMNNESFVVLKNINDNISTIALDIKRMADAVVKLCNNNL